MGKFGLVDSLPTWCKSDYEAFALITASGSIRHRPCLRTFFVETMYISDEDVSDELRYFLHRCDSFRRNFSYCFHHIPNSLCKCIIFIYHQSWFWKIQAVDGGIIQSHRKSDGA